MNRLLSELRNETLSAEHTGISEKCGGGARSGNPPEGQGEGIRKTNSVTPLCGRGLFKFACFPAHPKAAIGAMRKGAGEQRTVPPESPLPNLVVYSLFWVGTINLLEYGTPEWIRTTDLLLRSLAVKAYIVDSWSGLGRFPSPVRVSPALIAQHNEQRLFVPGAFRSGVVQSRRSSFMGTPGRHVSDHLTVIGVLPC